MNLIKYRKYRENDKTVLLIGFSILIILFCLFQCADRDRNNIFDPSSGIDSLDISLYITSSDSVITIHWYAPRKVDYKGFDLYRKTVNQDSFQQIASFSADKLEYTDRNIINDITYQYYIKVVGEDNESPPTKVLQVTPGPLKFYILDYWGFAIYKLTYDVQHILSTRYTSWMPENLALDPAGNWAMITYPQLHYYDVYSRRSGSTELSGTEFNRPFGCIYNPKQNKFWFTDSSGYLYSLDPLTASAELIDQNLVQPTQIIYTEHGIFVMDIKTAQIIRFTTSGQRQETIENMGDTHLIRPIYINYASNNAELYIIDRVSDDNRILYRYSFLSDSVDIVNQHKYLNGIQVNTNDNSVWISINEPENSVLMQLSSEGIRLNEIAGFSGISDFKYISETNTIIVADPVDYLVKHIRPNGSVIGVFNKASYPSKVYVE